MLLLLLISIILLQSVTKRNDELTAAHTELVTAHARQLKMYEDALEALRKEVAALEAEGRDLRLANAQLRMYKHSHAHTCGHINLCTCIYIASLVYALCSLTCYLCREQTERKRLFGLAARTTASDVIRGAQRRGAITAIHCARAALAPACRTHTTHTRYCMTSSLITT